MVINNASRQTAKAKFGKHEEKEAALNETSEISVMVEETCIEIDTKEKAGEVGTSIKKFKTEIAGQEASQSQEAEQVCHKLIQDENNSVSSDNTNTSVSPQKSNKAEETAPAKVGTVVV